MKTKIFNLVVAILFCFQATAQSALTPANQHVDFAIVEQTSDLQIAFEGQYHLTDFKLESTMPRKMGPVGKGALIGFGVGIGVGLAGGIATGTALNDGFNTDGFEALTIPLYMAGGGVLGMLAGTLVGAGIQLAQNSKAKKNKNQEAIDYRLRKPLTNTRSITPEIQIISLSHSF